MVDLIDKSSAKYMIHKARFHLLMKYPFYGYMASGLGLVANSVNTQTMATDGQSLIYNAGFVEKMDIKDLIFILMHEIGHVMCLHHVRFPANVDFDLWNIAADYVVNQLLRDVHGLTSNMESFKHTDHASPVGEKVRYLYDHQFKDMTSEMVYATLKKDLEWQKYKNQIQQNQGQPGQEGQQNQGQPGQEGQQNQGQPGQEGQQNQGQPGQGDQQSQQDQLSKTEMNTIKELISIAKQNGQVVRGSKDERSETQRISSDMIKNSRMAKNNAKRPGKGGANIPGIVLDTVEEITSTTQEWQHILRDYFNRFAQTDTSYKVPDRRFSGMDVVMPSSMILDSLDFVIVIDVSPSVVDSDVLNHLISQTRHMMEDVQFNRVFVIYCADFVTGYQEFSKEDKISLDYTGGYGTTFYPAFEKVADLGLDPACLVYFTDMECYPEDYGPAPNYPVLWAVCGPNGDWGARHFLGKNYEDLPFGTIINLELSKKSKAA